MATASPRKVVKAKRVLPSVPAAENAQLKSVTFNDEIIETSIGGTQRMGKIKQDNLHFDAPVVSNNNGSSNTKLNHKNTVTHTYVKTSGNSNQIGKENKNVTSSVSGVKLTSSLEMDLKQPVADMTNGGGNNNCNNRVSHVNGSPKKSVRSAASGSKDPQLALLKKEKSKVEKLNLGMSSNSVGAVPTNSSEKSYLESDSEGKESYKGSVIAAPLSTEADDDRNTTFECIEGVAQSPFRTPTGKNSRRHTLESRIFATPDCYRDVNFDSPRRMLPMIQDEIVEDGEDSCSIMVAVRVRPFGQRELSDSNTRCVVSMYNNETTITSDNGTIHKFAYDFSFWSHDRDSGDFCDQGDVYSQLAQPLLGKAFEGYNTCLFAYGQTGSGKSYSIMGHGSERGIIPRFCAELFSKADNLTSRSKVKVNVEISFFEIYNEKIHDLLASTRDKGAKKATLKVREHPVLGPYVEGLSTYVVNSFDDMEGWITLGNKSRATAATGMNDKSSRSHSVFTIMLTQTKTEIIEGQEHDHSINSKINLVDLAGSERQSLAHTSGERLREGANINKSLLTLGKVISLLSERAVTSKKRKIFIPYRDSVLTWLLKESLGGNSKTVMIATISPSNLHIEETLSTLRYAQQARSIVNMVHINEDPKAKIIRQLRAEIDRLRAEQGGVMNEEALAASMSEIARLKSEMEEMSRSWQERLRQAEMLKAKELQTLERAGITFKVDNKLPNLVNLNEDPQLSEMLLYVIKEGQTRVGRTLDPAGHDIQLTSALIADNHCVINSANGVVDITPNRDAPTYVNGDLISLTTTLHHGDRVILGGDHFFRFNHPMEVQKNKGEVRPSTDVKDFDFAKQELHTVQEARLQAELEGELEKTKKELKGLAKVLSTVEQTHKEDQSTIHTLKKQNMMLEQEVLAGRKRQKNETSTFQQTTDDMAFKSKIVELLEAERKLASDRLEKLRLKRAEMSTPARLVMSQESCSASLGQSSVTVGSPASRRDLYKVALLLREANKINQYLSTNLVFSREDISDGDGQDGGQTKIRVVNTRHRMFTLWSVSKFEEKLAQMRDMYQNEDDDGEVFNDPEDIWEKESSVSPPPLQQNELKNALRGPSLSRTAPVMSFRNGTVGVSSPRSSQDLEVSMVRACKSLLSSVSDSLSALSFAESVVDKVLSTCQRIKDSMDLVLESEGRKVQESDWAKPMLQLMVDVNLLASHTTLWSSFYEGLQSPLLRDLMAQSTDQIKVIGHQATSLLQGCEGKLTSLMSESSQKLTTALLSLCQTCGELSLATDSPVLRLDQSGNFNNCKLSPEISGSFQKGCGVFVNRALEGGLSAMESYTQRCAQWRGKDASTNSLSEMSLRVSHILSCTQAVLQNILHTQQELDQDSSMDNLRPPQYYSAAYKRLQGIASHSSAMVDSSHLLVESAEHVVQGLSQDHKRLERCAELIQRSSQRLLAVSSYTYTPTRPLSLSSSSSSTSCPATPLPKTSSPISDRSGEGTQSFTSVSSISLSQSGSSISSTLTTTDDSNTTNRSSNNDKHSNSSSNVTVKLNTTDVFLLTDRQRGQLQVIAQEVSKATSLFSEYARKSLSSAPERGCTTPRGKRLLPASPEKSVVTPAVSTTHLRKLDIKRTVALASREEKDK